MVWELYELRWRRQGGRDDAGSVSCFSRWILMNGVGVHSVQVLSLFHRVSLYPRTFAVPRPLFQGMLDCCFFGGCGVVLGRVYRGHIDNTQLQPCAACKTRIHLPPTVPTYLSTYLPSSSNTFPARYLSTYLLPTCLSIYLRISLPTSLPTYLATC